MNDAAAELLILTTPKDAERALLASAVDVLGTEMAAALDAGLTHGEAAVVEISQVVEVGGSMRHVRLQFTMAGLRDIPRCTAA